MSQYTGVNVINAFQPGPEFPAVYSVAETDQRKASNMASRLFGIILTDS